MTKTIMHPDYWVEIPEGEVIVGLSDEQRLSLWLKYRNLMGYQQASEDKQRQQNAIIEKLRRGEEISLAESRSFGPRLIPAFKNVRPQQTLWIKRFYIARFPLTEHQYHLFTHGTPALKLPGMLEGPETLIIEAWSDTPKEVYIRCAAAMPQRISLSLCSQLNARLPTEDEWEKAARGSDGRLYPWGNEWDETRGHFYGGQPLEKTCAGGGRAPVDAFLGGVSPYGVWGMAGGLPELVTLPPKEILGIWEINGEKVSIVLKGTHTRESDPLMAFYHHVVARPGYGDWVALRPTLDEWPKTQW